jgi:hypothetical protein
VIFGYGGENIGKHLLEKVGSTSMARSSETGLSGWTELASRGRESPFGLYGMRRRRRMLGDSCGVVGGV